ncbi:MAG: sugar ABC transporter ATP-binding protein [Vallitaleaceae bacterium]|nr:sugar ABC transporter ATP-binding protein [Vallitaleaceae bacterium]
MDNKNSNIILSIQDVEKSFPGVKALDQVSIDIRRGEVHGLVGENGAGKSTLMKILSGVLKKDAGTITFDGAIVHHTSPVESQRMGMSIIYQELNLVNTMSVGENVFLGRFKEMGGMRGTHTKAKALLDSIGANLDTYQLVDELSVSEKQMVEIAKALSFESKLIIMDEPSSSLTQDEMDKLIAVIKQLKEKGITIIYISHKLDEIFELCNRVTIMRDGHVIDTQLTSDITRNEMIAKMVGRTIENEFPERPKCDGEVLLQVKSLNTNKLKNVSFKLRKGEILGFVGLVGAGRTEIVRAIFGADQVKGHEILIDGKVVTIKNPKDAMNAGLALVTEDRKQQGLVLSFTVEKNVSMASLDRLSKFGILNKSKEKEMAERQVKGLNVKTPTILTKVSSLSGGNQQKVVLGGWLETGPRVLILDEPTRGIDVGAKYEIYLLMKEIAESGGAIILISSELPEVLNMSNRVLTVYEGRITGEFDPLKTTPDHIMRNALGMGEEEQKNDQTN